MCGYQPFQSQTSYHLIFVVGRTGSGKVRCGIPLNIPTNELRQSSLTLSLLRGIITEGTVLFDGRRTDEINLDILRANITIIPQTVSTMRFAKIHLPHFVCDVARAYERCVSLSNTSADF